MLAAVTPACKGREMLTSNSASVMSTVDMVLTLPTTAFDRSLMTASTGDKQKVQGM